MGSNYKNDNDGGEFNVTASSHETRYTGGSEEEEEERGRRRDDNHHHERENGDDAKKKKKRRKLMQDSDQTDEERRQLRKEFRDLKDYMHNHSMELEDIKDTQLLSQVSHENNQLFAQVCYTREAVLDGNNLQQITNGAAKRLNKVIQVPRYDAKILCQRLVAKSNRNHNNENNNNERAAFPWIPLGQSCSLCFNSIPSRVQFLNGPLVADYIPKTPSQQQRQRRQKIQDEEEERPVTLRQRRQQQEQGQPSHQSIVEQNISQVRNALWETSKTTTNGNLDAIPFLFNRKSFTQTVENMFYFSFLVQKGMAGIHVEKPNKKEQDNEDDDSTNHNQDNYQVPRVCAILDQEHTNGVPNKSRQAILSINMRQWRRLNRSIPSNHCLANAIPHREPPSQDNTGQQDE